MLYVIPFLLELKSVLCKNKNKSIIIILFFYNKIKVINDKPYYFYLVNYSF